MQAVQKRDMASFLRAQSLIWRIAQTRMTSLLTSREKDLKKGKLTKSCCGTLLRGLLCKQKLQVLIKALHLRYADFDLYLSNCQDWLVELTTMIWQK